MDNEFSKVSLGFAEFVSQLIHETFDAILESQNYQIDKYLELEEALNTTSTQVFRNKYVSDQELEDFTINTYGFVPKTKMAYNGNELILLKSIVPETEQKQSFLKNQLTEYGLAWLVQYTVEKLMEFKKAKLRIFVERPELARLMVDSGEIKAKLELFCLNETKVDTLSNPVKAKIAEPTKTGAATQSIAKTSFSIKDIKMTNGLNVKELVDPVTNLKTILIDKSTLRNTTSMATIPSARLIANPVNTTQTSNLYSEVTIKFRSI